MLSETSNGQKRWEVLFDELDIPITINQMDQSRWNYLQRSNGGRKWNVHSMAYDIWAAKTNWFIIINLAIILQ